MKKQAKAVVVFSGGQDSMTILALALSEYEEVHAISFEYNQTHSVELVCARNVTDNLWKIPHLIFEIPALAGFNDSGLIKGNEQDVSDDHNHKEGLPASFVPARNALFLTMAHGYAQKIGAEALFTGVCQTDYSGYPDCREEFILQLEKALNTGYETDITIRTPLMFKTKAETFELAEDLDVLQDIIDYSHTCYRGDHSTFHNWGYGCGECPACELRRKGYHEFLKNKHEGENA